jgi:branched-chain amino acid transport system permease protein
MYDLIATLLAIVVLGGLGSIPGTLLASVVLLVVEDITAAVWSPTWASAMSYAVLAAVLIMRPAGLLGAAGVRTQ